MSLLYDLNTQEHSMLLKSFASKILQDVFKDKSIKDIDCYNSFNSLKLKYYGAVPNHGA